ncbi:MAG: type ISP restriction/modification enzyme [Candidatus Latescibacterota bacterium]
MNALYQTGLSGEHSYRGDLQNLLSSILPDTLVTNEPKRIACGAPDYILTKKDIPVGYIEAKDLGADLENKNYQEQFDRYKHSLDNLIITNYLDFQLFQNGEKVTTLSIGTIQDGKVVIKEDDVEAFSHFIKSFATQGGQVIKSSSNLAKMMANKAKLLANVIELALNSDEEKQENSTLKDQMLAFKQILIHDITPKMFSDIYAQTIAYGMFAARLHDATLPTFTRQEAAELIPKSNPFLRKLFGYIAGPDIDQRILWIVDDLADIFRATDVAWLLRDFGKATKKTDPIVHFYETFLAEYDPKLRKSRGVWYTPEPVVNFIVRAVDDILKTEFGLSEGLADTSKTEITLNTQVFDKRSSTGLKKTKKEVHKVQILDPAAGTGTFLAEVVKHIHKKFEGQQGIWSNYVDEHLIPRLNGFELLMASYAMAHLKLDLLLAETGYKATKDQRLKIYLTNSLEEHHPDTGTLWSSWLSNEANEANHIKRDTPVMVVLGNPPYSGISTNNGNWISKLIEDYKYVDGKHFGERKHWLQDDYVKFIRYGEHFIEKNTEGVLAFINNHSFLDNPTFRGMRWHLLNTFDKIYVIDLHGNFKKKEIAPDGSKDENVFDIQQGVSINILVKTEKKKRGELAKVFHRDIFGSRESKYCFLQESTLESSDFQEITYKSPYYFFVPKDYANDVEYQEGFSVNELMSVNVTGIVTARDAFVIDMSEESLIKRMVDFSDFSKSDSEIRTKYFSTKGSGKYPPGDSRGWKMNVARTKIQDNDHESFIKTISYRPFDDRKIYYSSDMVDWGREGLMRHFASGDNIGLLTCRQSAVDSWEHVGVTKYITDDSRISNRTKERGYVFPLYLYSENGELFHVGDSGNITASRIPNIDLVIARKIADIIGAVYYPVNEYPTIGENERLTPENIFDYIYATLHSPSYRDKYKEFLKIDFPRVPYPTDRESFWQLVKLGEELRQLHLLESPKVEQFITTYPEGGSNTVEKISFITTDTTPVISSVACPDMARVEESTNHKTGRVYINETQYFDNVPEIAWNFYIGGYQPAQKWIKDRKGRTLTFEDIRHYQQMIVSLFETDRIMKEIDKLKR